MTKSKGKTHTDKKQPACRNEGRSLVQDRGHGRGRGQEKRKQMEQKRNNHNTRRNKKQTEALTEKILRTKGERCFPMKTIKKEELHKRKIWSSCIVLGGYNRVTVSENAYDTDKVTAGIITRDNNNARNCRSFDVAKYSSIKYIGSDLKTLPTHLQEPRFWELKIPNDRAILILLDGDDYDPSKERTNNIPLIPTLKLSDKYIVLTIASHSDALCKSILCKGNDDVLAMRSTRRSILSGRGRNHHKSKGQYYAFGLKGSYGKMIHGISIDTYVGTYVPNEASQVVQAKINDAMTICEKTIEHYCPGLWTTSFSVLSKLVEYSTKMNILNGVGNTHGCLCVNAQTRVPHTEADSSYTACAVPSQDIQTINNYFFVFHITDLLSIKVPMKAGLVMLYNAHLITHQQVRFGTHTDDYDFHNYTRYCSKKLAANAGATIARVFEENAELDVDP